MSDDYTALYQSLVHSGYTAEEIAEIQALLGGLTVDVEFFLTLKKYSGGPRDFTYKIQQYIMEKE